MALPVGYVMKEIISSKFVNINVFEITGTSRDFSHHVDCAPQERILANVPPKRADNTYTSHNIKCIKSLQYVDGYVSRKFNPTDLLLVKDLRDEKLIWGTLVMNNGFQS
ncbi:hypothetical protein TSUD_245040 [Trifolium subterraneum]|uniref:Uncharacterized protein n=1 Tax=Trifolium subterraneum TaxID=3900 RepID=A0A2Z6PAV1_TRISU|nr:hypothetical protein TSUD_245040 [Trifolium subterraneum]